MATKEYRFPHELGETEAALRIRPVLDDLIKAYQLNLDAPVDGTFRLHRTGVDANVKVGARDIVVSVDLNWFLEKAIRRQLEDQLHQKFPPILKA
jgi:hypothetical protein